MFYLYIWYFFKNTHTFSTSTAEWKPRDFANFTYNEITKLLQLDGDNIILGHVTFEKSIINMCFRENEMRGMSVLAGYNNKKSCGHGMYFFLVSEVGSFDKLSCGDNRDVNPNVCTEFQGFMYALMRGFQSSTAEHYSAVAVLLTIVPRNLLNIFKNACNTELIMLDSRDKGGCSCERRYENKNNTNIKILNGSCDASVADVALILKNIYCKEKTNEQLNSVALLNEVVNLYEL
jgi:hypothetical protein